MQALLRAGLDAGALGFSSSWARTHNDADGHMVPSRFATRDELVDLCCDAVGVRGHVARVHPHGRPVRAVGGRADGRRCRPPRNGRSTGTCSASTPGTSTNAEQKLEAGDLRARARRPRRRAHRADELPGVPVVPLGLRPRRHARLGRRHGPPARREAEVLRRRGRAGQARRARAERREPAAHARQLGRTSRSTTSSRPRTSSTGAAWSARSPRRRAASAWDVLTCASPAPTSSTPASAPCPRPRPTTTGRRASQVWRDRRALIGASDAGAHLDLLASFNYATEVLGKAVRERQLLPLEEAVNLLTDVPAQLYGLTERGRVGGGLEGRRRRPRSRDHRRATTCACAWTCPAAPAGSTPRPTASSTCS